MDLPSGDVGQDEQQRADLYGFEVYQYQELKSHQIRLYRLYQLIPTGSSDARSCMSRSANLEKSMTRPMTSSTQLFRIHGDQRRLFEASKNGRSLEIRENLWHFLSRLQSYTWCPRYLWADAICINQKGVSKKTCQVALMGQIFRCAMHLFAWLGMEDADSALVMNVFSRHGSMLHWTDCEIESQRIWQATKAFFERPYWGRTWIVQELALAQVETTVFCGADMLSYKFIRDFHSDVCKRLQFDPKQDVRCRCWGRDLISDPAAAVSDRNLPVASTELSLGNSHTLLDLLYTYQGTPCADPRDKVVSMMSMQRDISPHLVPIILIYSLDVHQLFILLLTIHTQGHKLFPDLAEHYRVSGTIDSRSTLTTSGVMVIDSLGISSGSVRGFLDVTPQGTDPFCNCLVEFEHINLGGEAGITSLNRTNYDNEKNVCVFDAIDNGLAFRPHMRGIGVDLQYGDQVHRARNSDVGLALRHIDENDELVSWVIVGEGVGWTPNKDTWARFEILQHGRLPAPVDFTSSTDSLGFPGLSITVDWYVAVSITDGLTEMSYDSPKPNDARLSKEQPTRAARKHDSAGYLSKYEFPKKRNGMREVVISYCLTRGLQQLTRKELEDRFKEASGKVNIGISQA